MIGQSNIYRTLFEEIHDGILIMAPDGTILESNRAAENILGYSSEEMKNINVVSAFVDPTQYQEIILSLQDDIPLIDFGVQLFSKEQFVVNCSLTTYIETDLNKNITAYLLVIRNITRQIQTEKALNDRLRFETGVAASFSCLFEDQESSVDEALHHIMRAADVGRVSILRAAKKEDDSLIYELIHEVDISDPPGTSSLDEKRLSYPTEFFVEDGFQKVNQDLLKGNEGIVQISDLKGQAREIFENRSVKSMLLLPLRVDADWFGVLVLSDLVLERNWEDQHIDLMQTFSSMIGTYFARKQGQLKLEQQQLLLRQVVDLNPEFVFVKDRNGRYELVNHAFAARYNMTSDDIIGQTDEVLTNSIEKMNIFHEADLAILNSGQSETTLEDEVAFPDGSTRWLKTTKRPIHNTDGEATHLLGLSVDMTQQIEVQNALHERERFLKTILDTLPVAVFWKDRNNIYLGNNKAFAQVAGVNEDDLVGKSDFDLLWGEKAAESIQAEDIGIMEHGVGKLGIIAPHLQPDGTKLWFDVNKIPLKDGNGNVSGILGTYNNITERMSLQEEIRSSLERRSRQVVLTTQVAQDIANATDLNQLYREVVTQVKEQFGFYHVQLLKYDPALDTVALVAGYGEVGDKMLEMNHALPMGVGLIGTAAATGESVLRPQISKDPNWKGNPLLPETKGEIAVPIMSHSDVLGVLDVQSNKMGALSEDDQIMLEGLCGQIAIAIESTNLRQELEAQLRELLQLQRRLSGEAWSEFSRLKDENRVEGFEYDLTSLRPYNTNNSPYNEFGTGQEQNMQTLSQPVSLRGQTIGYLGIKNNKATPIASEEALFLDAVASEVAGALEAARLFEEIEKSLVDQARLATELETVAQVSTAAATVLDSEYLLQSVVELAKDSFQLYHSHVYLISEKGDYLELIAGSGTAGQLMALEGHKIVITEDSVVARAARNREGVMENDVRRTVDFLPNPMLPNTKSEIAVPMIVGDKVIGVLDLQSDVVDAFNESDLRIYTILASQIAVAHENAKQYAIQVETAQKLREVDILKSEFLASMSHELRTPLNSIIGFADVLLEGLDGVLNERMEEDVRLIRQSGAHLRELIGDILDMTKIEAGKMDLRYETIDISQMAQDIMKTAHPLAQEKSLALLLDLDEAVAEIPADRTRLRQVLWNIMGNAIKFTEKGSVTLRIAAKKDHVLVSIKDTGIGISESHIPIVFEQFRQVDGSMERVAGGAGLGMPITKRLIELHGGDIWIESVIDQGSTFYFTLPYEPPIM